MSELSEVDQTKIQTDKAKYLLTLITQLQDSIGQLRIKIKNELPLENWILFVESTFSLYQEIYDIDCSIREHFNVQTDDRRPRISNLRAMFKTEIVNFDKEFIEKLDGFFTSSYKLTLGLLETLKEKLSKIVTLLHIYELTSKIGTKNDEITNIKAVSASINESFTRLNEANQIMKSIKTVLKIPIEWKEQPYSKDLYNLLLNQKLEESEKIDYINQNKNQWAKDTINYRNEHGITPLMICSTESFSLEIFRVVIELVPNPFFINQFGYTTRKMLQSFDSTKSRQKFNHFESLFDDYKKNADELEQHVCEILSTSESEAFKKSDLTKINEYFESIYPISQKEDDSKELIIKSALDALEEFEKVSSQPETSYK